MNYQDIMSALGGASNCTTLGYNQFQGIQQAALSPRKERTMFQEIKSDVKSFILEHRGIIYFVCAALLIDHLFFKGAFKARLQLMCEKLIAKVEDKIK